MSSVIAEESMVLRLFPLIERIQNAELRSSVVAVWDEAIRTGNTGHGWTEDQLRSIPFTLLAGRHDMRFIEHLNSCAAQCLAIAGVLSDTFADRVPVCVDTLLAGAHLADVGKLFEFETTESAGVVQGDLGKRLRHPFTGTGLCMKHDVPVDVMHIVAAHSHEGDRIERSIECIIFHHADFVDFDIAKAIGRGALA